MLAITQFEVHVLEHGRWTIHARYAGEQRQAAVMDARTTEFATGHPTKVVCETYFPEIDESELVTAYISPKARELREAAKQRRAPSPSARAAAVTAGVTRKSRPRQRLNVSNLIFRAVVAAGISLAAAALTTGLVSWALNRTIKLGLPIDADMTGMILTGAYVVTFLFFFTSLFRSRLPLHRLLADLWHPPPAADKETKRSIVAAIAPRLRPKRPPAVVAAEEQRAKEELKILRGDLTAAAEPGPPAEPVQDAKAETPVPVAPPAAVFAPGPQETIAKAPEKPGEKTGAKAPKKAEPEKKVENEKNTGKKQKVEEVREQPELPAAAAAIEVPAPPEATALERMVLRRFVMEVIKPATTGTIPDDPVTRRGVALVIAGAVAALADTTRTDRPTQVVLLTDALELYGMSKVSAELFIGQYEQLARTPANANLVNIGRSALAKHVEGADIARVLAAALASWRTPFGQPQGLQETPQAPAVQAPHAAGVAEDIYLLTELRLGTPDDAGAPDENSRDAAMGLHNSVVRSVLGSHNGHEIKHTGTGIFARFPAAPFAVAAASEIQRRFVAMYGQKLAIGLVSGRETDADPLVTADIIRRAQTATAQACDGEILAERRIEQAAAPDSHAATDADTDEDETALVKISAGEPADAPALYVHSPEPAVPAESHPVNTP